MSRSPNTHEQQATPGSFCKLLLVPNGLDEAIPSAFESLFQGVWPETIKLKISIDCIWQVGLKEEDGKIIMDARWSELSKHMTWR